MKFNRAAPFVLAAIAVVSAIWLIKVKDQKVVAGENELIISEDEKIPYDSIQQIDKTHFDSKGFFIISYKTSDGKDALKALSYKKYDNLKPLLEHLVSKIT
jgi:flagellar biogenesis protein FliO